MLGLFLLYFIGKSFYELADKFGKSKWGFAILGIGAYYLGTFIGGIIIYLVYELALSQSMDEMNDLLLGFLAMPIGILVCWGFYKMLEGRWSKPTKYATPDDVLDGDLLNPLP